MNGTSADTIGSQDPPEEEPKYIDGQYSIEHQIDVHVRDLVEFPDQPSSVLEGLRYLLDYRLSNRQHPHMDIDLMRRLAYALLEVTGQRQGALFARRRLATAPADQALSLFRDLLVEVDEFVAAVGAMPVGELRERLQLHCRLYPEASLISQSIARDILKMLGRFGEWRDFVKAERVEEVEEVFKSGASEYSLATPDSRLHLQPPPSLYFDRSTERVLDMFRTDGDRGLSSQDYEEKMAHYGSNTIPQQPQKRLWKMLLDQCNDFMIILLLIAAILSPIIEPEDKVSPIVLIVVVVLNVTIGVVQESRASSALSSLLTLQIPKARVRRMGMECEVDAQELVPGDIVVLQEGDSVPADLRLIRTSRLEIVESLLTGESVPVAKQTGTIRIRSRRLPLTRCSNCAFMGSLVARGTGVGVVVRTGTRTEMGVISSALSSEAQINESPLQLELKKLGMWLVGLAVFLCILIVLIGLFVNKAPLKHMLHYGLNLAVSVIPEGLVAVVTVAMALAVSRMAQRKAIVRRLPVVETLGAVSVICTDKTGTLTMGKMQVQAVHGDLKECYTVCAICNNASINSKDGTVIGADTTEVALLAAALINGFNKTEMMLTVKSLIEIPFDSERKLMSTLIWDREDRSMILSKGAPEMILAKCTKMLSDKGAIVELEDHELSKLAKIQAEWSEKGWRVLGLAKTSISAEQATGFRALFSDDSSSADIFDQASDTIERDLCFVGLVALVDPPRPNIAESIAACRRAGIDVVMITGDHPVTAAAIARQIGILDTTGTILKGREVDILGEEGLRQLPSFPQVFARVSPQNKLAIVQALQQRSKITAMTGDGVNDAPAIRRADIGIAMGLTGTDIAKQAADIILADDNFATIISAVEEGRRVYDNVTKFVVYLLACNSAEIWIVLIALLLGLPPPLASVHILWANIIADIPPSLSLSCEPPEEDLLLRSPRSKSDHLLNQWNVVFVLLQGLAISLLSLCRYYILYKDDDSLGALRSEAFVCLTVLQLVLAFCSRSLSSSLLAMNLWTNPWMILAVFVSTMSLLLGCYVPKLNELLEMEPLNVFGWLRIAGCSLALIVFSELLKLIKRNT